MKGERNYSRRSYYYYFPPKKPRIRIKVLSRKEKFIKPIKDYTPKEIFVVILSVSLYDLLEIL